MLQLLIKLRPLRPRPNEAHAACKNTPKLGKLIKLFELGKLVALFELGQLLKLVDVVEVEVRGVNVNSVLRQLNPAAQSSRELKPAGR